MSTALSRELFVERTKLTANAFDRASTVAFTVGVFTPTAGLTFGIDPFVGGIQAVHAMIVSAWVIWGGLLHSIARSVLNGLGKP